LLPDTASFFVDTGVAAATSYEYRIRGRDAAAIVSEYGAVVRISIL
jgi:hypothetical protein